MHHLVQAFKQQRIPIFLSGQTIGPLGQYQSHDAMAKSIVESVDCLTVRDSNYSARYLSLINAQPQELVQTFDDAYTLPYEDEMLPGEVSDHMNHGNCICVNVTDYTCATGQQKSFIATLCEKLIQTYDSNLFLVSHTPADLVALWEIRDSINNQWKDRIAIPDTREWRDAKLKKLIASCRLAIGGRYHFIVFAGTSNTPFVGMCGNHYSYIKQDGFARALGQERYILTERETWDMDLLLSRVDERIDQPLNLSEKFERPSISMQRFGRWLNEKFSAGRAAAA